MKSVLVGSFLVLAFQVASADCQTSAGGRHLVSGPGGCAAQAFAAMKTAGASSNSTAEPRDLSEEQSLLGQKMIVETTLTSEAGKCTQWELTEFTNSGENTQLFYSCDMK